MLKKFLKTAIAVLTLAGAANAHATLLIAIDQKGAEDQISLSSPNVWNFGITQTGADYFSKAGLKFDSASFAVKKHEGTTAPLVFNLYSGLGGAGNGNTLLRTVTLSSGQFDNQYQDSEGNFFDFTPTSLGAGYYSVELSTTAPDQVTKDYQIKSGKLGLYNMNEEHQVALGSSYWLQDQGTGDATASFNGTGDLGIGGGVTPALAMAPEPSTMFALFAITGLTFGGSVVRRFKK